jgi:hypothetical protein
MMAVFILKFPRTSGERDRRERSHNVQSDIPFPLPYSIITWEQCWCNVRGKILQSIVKNKFKRLYITKEMSRNNRILWLSICFILFAASYSHSN